MKRAIFLVCAGLFGLTVSMPAFAGTREQKQTEQVDRNFPFQPGGQLTLKNFSGTIHITGSNRANVVIHAVRRATRERLDHIHLDIRATDSEIAIEANKRDDSWREHNDNVVETDFEIEVPQRTTLDVHGFSSEIHVESVEGRQKLYSFSGTDPCRGRFRTAERRDLQRRDQGRARTRVEQPRGRDEDVQRRHRRETRLDSSSGTDRLQQLQRIARLKLADDLSRRQSPAHPGRARRRRGTNLLQFKTFSGDVAHSIAQRLASDTGPSGDWVTLRHARSPMGSPAIAVWPRFSAACSRSAPRFSLDNARAHVEMLAGTIGSRPIGTPENARARQYIVDQLRLYGFDVRVQETDARRAGDRTHRARLEHHRRPFGNRARRDRPDLARRLRRRRARRGRRWIWGGGDAGSRARAGGAKRSTSHADGPRHRWRRGRPDGSGRADRGS